MKSMIRSVLSAAALLIASSTPSRAAEAAPLSEAPAIDPGNLRAFIALARADLKTEKTYIIAQNIAFTADEAAGFWALHGDYHAALNRLLDERLAILGEYAAVYPTMTDDQAKDLAHAFDVLPHNEEGLTCKREHGMDAMLLQLLRFMAVELPAEPGDLENLRLTVVIRSCRGKLGQNRKRHQISHGHLPLGFECIFEQWVGRSRVGAVSLFNQSSPP